MIAPGRAAGDALARAPPCGEAAGIVDAGAPNEDEEMTGIPGIPEVEVEPGEVGEIPDAVEGGAPPGIPGEVWGKPDVPAKPKAEPGTVDPTEVGTTDVDPPVGAGGIWRSEIEA